MGGSWHGGGERERGQEEVWEPPSGKEMGTLASIVIRSMAGEGE
jgi:hypothetical protein